jgi:outer membrane protein assembly factor BamB
MATTILSWPLRLLRPSRGRLSALAGVTVLSTSFVLGSSALATNAATPAVTTQWYQYHGDALGAGVAVGIHAVNLTTPAWTSHVLDGQLYGEPLVWKSEVLVATENDSVYALSATTGKLVWSRHLGRAVPARDLPCGDISPSVGITGTPVIDPVRREIFVVVDKLVNGKPSHELEGLSLTSGAVEMSRAVDTPGADAAAYLQRTGLTIDNGSVIFAMGGNYGDCSTYHGVVGSVREAGGVPRFFIVDAKHGDTQGAVWMGGAAPAVDSSGNVWVTSGNGSVTSPGKPYDDSDGALELSSTLRLESYFAPRTWASDNSHDDDLSTVPAVLSDGQVVVTGKSGIIYLVKANHLGGVGGQEVTISSDCGNDLDGGVAIHGATVYLPCLNGPIAVRVTTSPVRLKVVFRSSEGGGPPILVAQRLWTIGSDGTLYGLNSNTGAVMQQANVGNQANHFPTPSVGDGLLLAASATQVIAFHAK